MFCAWLSSRVSAEMEGPVLSLAHQGPCYGCSWDASRVREAVSTELLASWQVWGWLADAVVPQAGQEEGAERSVIRSRE